MQWLIPNKYHIPVYFVLVQFFIFMDKIIYFSVLIPSNNCFQAFHMVSPPNSCNSDLPPCVPQFFEKLENGLQRANMPMNDADKHISLSFWASIALLYLRQLLTMQSFLTKLMGFYDNQSRSQKNSQPLDKPCLLGVRVTAATFVSKTLLVNCITNHTGKCEKLAPGVCLYQQYAMHSTCHTIHILIILVSSSWYWIFGHTISKQFPHS